VRSIGFSTVSIGERKDVTFTIRNAGTGTLTGTVSAPCPDFSIPGATSYSLGPNVSQTFIVRFTPTRVGAESCYVNTGSGCRPIFCYGTGQIGCELTPDSLDFGYVRYDSTAYRMFTLANHTTATISGTFTTTGWFDVPRRTYSIPAQSSEVFAVRLLDTAIPSCNGYEVLDGSAGTNDPICTSVTLHGIVSTGCDCTISPTSLDFGSLVVGDASWDLPVQITNSTLAPGLTGAVRVVSGDFVAPASYTCPSYGPGACAKCRATIGVSFHPQRLGPQIGKIVVEHPAGCVGSGAACDTITCTGTGVTAASQGR
jgi:hypothetical protein